MIYTSKTIATNSYTKIKDYDFFGIIFNTTKTKQAGITQPKLKFAKGMIFLIPVKFSLGIINPRKSGILKIKVTKTTPLNTNFDANLSSTMFNKINTIVIGYKNIKAGTAKVMIKST